MNKDSSGNVRSLDKAVQQREKLKQVSLLPVRRTQAGLINLQRYCILQTGISIGQSGM
ncbi:MAG: hypothetical protein WCF06_10400 [Nitrososphaeraceae archaeon]